MNRVAFWWLLYGPTIRRAALWGGLVAGGLILAYLISRDASTVLEYLRVLAWPAVVALAIGLFRQPIIRMLRGRVLKEIDLRQARLSFDAGDQEDAGVSELLALASGQGGEDASEVDTLRYGARIAGALLRSFQMQIDFLRALGNAPEGLTREAAEAWFKDRLERAGADDPDWDVAQLLHWLEGEGLVQLTPEGRIAQSGFGDDLVALADSFWYAPKSI